jgi:hypothetical protein
LTFGNATLSGTPSTVGDFSFSITVGDSTGAVTTKGFTLTVTSPTGSSLIVGGTLLPGKVGVDYNA